MWSHTRRAKLRLAKPKAATKPKPSPILPRTAPTSRGDAVRAYHSKPQDLTRGSRSDSQGQAWFVLILLYVVILVTWTFNLYYPNGLH